MYEKLVQTDILNKGICWQISLWQTYVIVVTTVFLHCQQSAYCVMKVFLGQRIFVSLILTL